MAYEDYTQTTREAPYLEEFRRNFLQGAFDLTKQPGATTGARGIADLDVFQTGAMDQYASNLGIDPKTGLPTGTGATFDPYFKSGLAALESAQKQYDPSTSNYRQFMNQYQSDVTNEALKQMDEQAQMAQNKLAGDSVKGGVFGGSRFAVEKSQLDNNLQDIKSRRIFQDLAQNFQQAQDKAIGTFESGRARDMSAAGMLPGMGAQQFNLGAQGLGSLFNFGQTRQAYDQGKLNEQFRVAEGKRLDPFNRLSYFGDVLAGVPSVSQTLTQKPLPYTNPLLGGIGAATAMYGAMNV
tara:strand:- start:3394 stop:4278 length:885 start_codon:yes stop_codon:yes gene_type:complete